MSAATADDWTCPLGCLGAVYATARALTEHVLDWHPEWVDGRRLMPLRGAPEHDT